MMIATSSNPTLPFFKTKPTSSSTSKSEMSFGHKELSLDTIAGDSCPSLEQPSSSSSGSDEGRLPPTFPTLPWATRLEEEHNPFEQSFSGISRQILPPVASIASPFRGIAGHLLWDSLRAGALSPSMLEGPANTNDSNYRIGSQKQLPCPSPDVEHHSAARLERSLFNRSSLPSPSTSHPQSNPGSPEPDSAKVKLKRKFQSNNETEDAGKRQSFLERNRLAALKCRQRKKQWLQNLQVKVEYLQHDNEQLYLHTNALREELVSLKSMLLNHKDCPINQQATLEIIERPIPGACTIVSPETLSGNHDVHRSLSSQHRQTHP